MPEDEVQQAAEADDELEQDDDLATDESQREWSQQGGGMSGFGEAGEDEDEQPA